MRHLLDTHALLWALTDPACLGEEALRIVRDPRSQLVVSAASAWEIATKHRIGRLPGADGIIGAYARHLNRLGVDRLPMSDEHALLAGRLEWGHRDPFDRMLAAQAMTESMTLITKDPALVEFSGVATIW